jgi:DNA sulfur modification protein DndE
MIDHIRVSQQARDHLLKIKRSTGLKNWNSLCRWAFCTSLAEPTQPTAAKIPADSNVEMTWHVFAGEHAELYWALLRARCLRDGLLLDDETLAMQFRLHLHRGIGYLAGTRMGGISGLLRPSIDRYSSSSDAS